MFEEFDLDEGLLSAIAETGFKKPTTIQKLAIPVALDARDILASAPTGTGKTAAFLIPAIQHLLDFPRKSPGFARVLIMTPTRELAIQVHEQAQLLAKHTELKLGVITGGVNYGSHTELLEKNLDLLVATPGRLMDYMGSEQFSCQDVDILVLDEADRMLDMGFRQQMLDIANEAKDRQQTLLFSATLEGRGIDSFAAKVLSEPESVVAEPPKKESGKIHQWIHIADNGEHKFALLENILKRESETTSIVFVKTRERLNELVGQLKNVGIDCNWLRGEMPQDKRNQAIESFRAGEAKVLVATDVAARGIDVPDVGLVINYDMPRSADIYVHRIGRTARAGKKGTAISLVEAHDIAILGKVERYTDQKLKRRIIQELRPKHKEAKAPVKKKSAAKKKKAKKKK
jgi:ATP-dependent RNA helicase SrmB